MGAARPAICDELPRPIPKNLVAHAQRSPKSPAKHVLLSHRSSAALAWSTHSDSSEWDIIPSFLRTCFVFLVMFFDGYMYMIQLLLSDVLPTRRTLEATVDGRQNHHLEEAFAVRGWVQGLNIALLN